MVNDQFGFPEKLALSHRVFSCSTASSTLVLKRLEATFHDAVAQESDRLIAGVPRKDEFSTLGIAISETGRLKQVFVDEEYGAPFLTSGEIFRQRYEPTRFLSNRLLPDESEWATQEGDLLLARSGQVGGIIGRGVWADRRFAGGCVSVDVLRLGAQNSQILPGYLLRVPIPYGCRLPSTDSDSRWEFYPASVGTRRITPAYSPMRQRPRSRDQRVGLECWT